MATIGIAFSLEIAWMADNRIVSLDRIDWACGYRAGDLQYGSFPFCSGGEQ